MKIYNIVYSPYIFILARLRQKRSEHVHCREVRVVDMKSLKLPKVEGSRL